MIVTITTDFGTADGFVGVMKGVILGIAPGATLIDISHDIPPCDIAAGAWVLNNSYSFFPTGSIHLAIVDPGVGSNRRGVIVKTKGYTFVAPDNGLMSRVLDHSGAVDAFWINRSRYWRAEVSATFQGRDIFAPIAGHLADGKQAGDLGQQIRYTELLRLPPSAPSVTATGVDAMVVYIDRFGNLITNAPASYLESARSCSIQGTDIRIGTTYSSVPRGHAMACAGSHGCVEIGVNQGSAAAKLKAGIGTPVTVNFR